MLSVTLQNHFLASNIKNIELKLSSHLIFVQSSLHLLIRLSIMLRKSLQSSKISAPFSRDAVLFSTFFSCLVFVVLSSLSICFLSSFSYITSSSLSLSSSHFVACFMYGIFKVFNKNKLSLDQILFIRFNLST